MRSAHKRRVFAIIYFMREKYQSRLSGRKRYLQVALNGMLDDAANIIDILPPSDRIIVEAGTPLIKHYGANGIRSIRNWWESRVIGVLDAEKKPIFPYVVADLKTMDRGATEAELAANAGASGAIALGSAPVETLDTFIAACHANGIDAMIDMMNVEFPISILRALKQPPEVVVLHRGVDEERDNRQKMLPLHEIRRVKGAYDMLVAVAGGDTPREVQSAAFNDADIVVVWKSVYEKTADTQALVENFLKTIK